MIIHRIPVYIALILCLITTYGLFSVKDNVMALKFELQEVKKQVQNEEDTIRILKAEVAYLGSPERIQKLAELHLHLETPKVTQMIKDPLTEGVVTEKEVAVREVRKNHKWRYKKAPSKYVTLAKGER